MGDVIVENKGFEEMMRKMEAFPQEMRKEMGKAILAASLDVEAAAKKNVKEKFGGVGHLAASINHKILKSKGVPITGVIGTNLAYAAIHEHGGTIEPKNAKWLTIPFKGVVGKARDYTDTFFQWKKSDEGNTLILYQNVEGGKPIPLFVLVKKSQVPARPYLNPALTANKENVLNKINKAIERSLKNVARK